MWHLLWSIRTFCRELCKNGLTDWLDVLVVDSGGPKEVQVQSYLPGGANVPDDTLPRAVQKRWTDWFAIWVVDSVRRRKHKFNRVLQVAPLCRPSCTLAQPGDTIEPSVCCVNAALCQITLTTCYYYWQDGMEMVQVTLLRRPLASSS